MKGGISVIYQFKDKQCSIKHMGFILEVKKLNSQTLQIKEMNGQSLGIDLLFFDKPDVLMKDLRNFFAKFDKFTRHVDEMSEKAPAGFVVAQGSELPGGDEHGEDEGE